MSLTDLTPEAPAPVETVDRVYWLVDVARVEAEVARLARRAKRIGAEPVRIEKAGEPEMRKLTRTVQIDGEWVEKREQHLVHPYRIVGAAPVIGGWTLAGVVEFGEDGATIVTSLHGQSVPHSYRTTNARCDHCNTLRRRAHVLVLRSEAGEHKQVGTSCIEDFTRSDADIDALLGAASFLRAIADACEEGERLGGGRGEPAVEVEAVLALAVHCARILGYVPRSKSGEEVGSGPAPTSLWVSLGLDGWNREQLAMGLSDPTEADQKRASEILAFMRSPLFTGDSDYAHNSREIARLSVCARKRVGLITSWLSPFAKYEAAEQEKSLGKNSVYLGSVGEPVIFRATVLRHRTFDTEYGTTTVVSMIDTAGNRVCWFASGSFDDESPFARGQVLTVKATVKKHQIDRYTEAQTTYINRATRYTPPAPKKSTKKAAKPAAPAAPATVQQDPCEAGHPACEPETWYEAIGSWQSRQVCPKCLVRRLRDVVEMNAKGHMSPVALTARQVAILAGTERPEPNELARQAQEHRIAYQREAEKRIAQKRADAKAKRHAKKAALAARIANACTVEHVEGDGSWIETHRDGRKLRVCSRCVEARMQ